MQAHAVAAHNPFADARERFEQLVSHLEAPEVMTLDHRELEDLIDIQGREVLLALLQGHLDLRGPGMVARGSVTGADEVVRAHVRTHERDLVTVFGPVRVRRLGYGAPGAKSLHPLDGALNLPPSLYSRGIRRRLASAAARISFEAAIETVAEATGVTVPKRQAEELVTQAAVDFEPFYQARTAATSAQASQTGALVVLSADGKGVVMRQQDLREATRNAAQGRTNKLTKRLSRGEKRNAKRMATVAAVYTLRASPREPADVVRDLRPLQEIAAKADRPRPEDKRVWASLAREPREVIGEAFEEGLRRDPDRDKTWVALVDGNKPQLRILHELARQHGVLLTIVLDLIHVIEYLWKAAYVFHAEGSKGAEAWVTERLVRILEGRATYVAAGMRRSATRRGLSTEQRTAVDNCARYLHANAPYLRYDVFLAAGFPIATGVIEGACRHVVKDRMDLTGARWSLDGAEAVLRLRSLQASGDLQEYWQFHERQALSRDHLAHYADGALPPTLNAAHRPALRRVK